MDLEKNLSKIRKQIFEGMYPFLEKVCEFLPLNITLYEKNGLCGVETDVCKYSQFLSEKGYLCKKKTYTFLNNIMDKSLYAKSI